MPSPTLVGFHLLLANESWSGARFHGVRVGGLSIGPTGGTRIPGRNHLQAASFLSFYRFSRLRIATISRDHP